MARTSTIKTTKETRRLEKVVTEDQLEEFNERARKLYSKIGHIQADLNKVLNELRAKHRDECKEKTAKIRKDLKLVEREFDQVQAKIYGGTYMADVECEVRVDLETKMVCVVRMDTRDVVERRPLQPGENQMEAFSNEQATSAEA